MDIKSKEARSRNMAKIKGKNTKPEMYIRSLLFREGLRYRVNYSAIEGKPDLYFPKYRTAIFVNGCFWHRHEGCKYAYTPKTNAKFWEKKFSNNIRRDDEVYSTLVKQNIQVIIIWECTVRAMKRDPFIEKKIIRQMIERIRIKQLVIFYEM